MDEKVIARVAKRTGHSKALVRDVLETYFQLRATAMRKTVEERGGRWGRPPKIDRRICRRALAMRKRGVSLRAAARAVGVPYTTLRYWLSSLKPLE